jgi:hypothetical protein
LENRWSKTQKMFSNLKELTKIIMETF